MSQALRVRRKRTRHELRNDRGDGGTEVTVSGERRPNEGPVIAIVDDDASVRRSLLRVVQSAGYEAEGFASAREFLAWLPNGRAACLVLDVHMSEMSGFELHDRLAVPIIFITAHDDVATRERIEKSSAVGHLRKPFDNRTMLTAIQRALVTDR